MLIEGFDNLASDFFKRSDLHITLVYLVLLIICLDTKKMVFL